MRISPSGSGDYGMRNAASALRSHPMEAGGRTGLSGPTPLAQDANRPLEARTSAVCNPGGLNTLHLATRRNRSPCRLSLLTAGDGEAVRQLVSAAWAFPGFSNFMVSEDIASGRLIELFPRTARYRGRWRFPHSVTSISGLQQLEVFLDWLGTLLR